ncbi:MAG: stage II sporulation protein R [Faecalibacterium sp.]
MRTSSPLSRREMALWFISLVLGLVLGSGLQLLLGWGRAQLDTGAALCADTLRLHVRADSDTVRDQTIKLAVRDAVLALADTECPAGDKDAALCWAAQNMPRIQLLAYKTMARLGASGPVRVRLVNMYFDTAQYASACLPAGRYDALRIELGDPEHPGKNWWCVLYPGLCRAACGGYALEEENDLVCGEYILRLRLVDWWQQRTADRTDHLLLALE